MRDGKLDTDVKAGGEPGRWPTWARVLASVAVLYHGSAIWVGAWSAPPSSGLEQALAGFFGPYYEATDQGHAYRYYSQPGPTPVITASLAFADGRPEKSVRIPERGTRPRLRYQRQLALANGLKGDFLKAKDHGDGSKSPWAHAFASHLGRSNPGCSAVTLRLQWHLIPDPGRVRELLAVPGGGPVDLDAEEFYTAPERIGVYPCDAS